MEHDWPTDPSVHLWGKWMPKNRTTIYRTCVHPECTEREEKDVSGA